MLIASVTPRRHDGGEFIKIEFDDGLQGGGSGSVAEAVRQGVVPDGVFGLQGEQSSDRVLPALRAGALVDRPPIADDGRFPAVADGVTIAMAGREAGDGMRPVIVGAGPTGLSTAIALARRAHQVAVIDSDGGRAYRRLRRDQARKERRT